MVRIPRQLLPSANPLLLKLLHMLAFETGWRLRCLQRWTAHSRFPDRIAARIASSGGVKALDLELRTERY